MGILESHLRIAKRLFSIFHDVTQKNFICTIVFRCESNYASIFTVEVDTVLDIFVI